MTRRGLRRAPSYGRLAALLAALGLAAAAVAACGGGGGGGGGGGPTPPPPPPQPQPAINFTGDSVAAPAVRLVRGAGSSATVLELEVRADQLPAVYALAFDLTYPSAALSFDAFAEGGFLDGNGVETSLQVAEPNPGRLVIGHSRLGEVGVIAGSGLLMTLRFDAAGAGTGEIAFERNQLFDQRGVEVRGASWAGGTVEVIP